MHRVFSVAHHYCLCGSLRLVMFNPSDFFQSARSTITSISSSFSIFQGPVCLCMVVLLQGRYAFTFSLKRKSNRQSIFYFFAVFVPIGKSRNILLHTNRIIFSFEMLILFSLSFSLSLLSIFLSIFSHFWEKQQNTMKNYRSQKQYFFFSLILKDVV